MTPIPETEAHLGSRIRSLRTARGMQVQQLASALGISSSAVSQIERGIIRPAVSRLPVISEVLRVSLTDLFNDAEPSPADSTLVVSRRGDAADLVMADGVTYRRLSAGHIPGLDLFESTWQPGSRSGGTGDAMTHSGWEGGTVMAGSLLVEVAGTSTLLETGDSISYAATGPHRLSNPSTTVVARAVWAIQTQGT